MNFHHVAGAWYVAVKFALPFSSEAEHTLFRIAACRLINLGFQFRELYPLWDNWVFPELYLVYQELFCVGTKLMVYFCPLYPYTIFLHIEALAYAVLNNLFRD